MKTGKVARNCFFLALASVALSWVAAVIWSQTTHQNPNSIFFYLVIDIALLILTPIRLLVGGGFDLLKQLTSIELLYLYLPYFLLLIGLLNKDQRKNRLFLYVAIVWIFFLAPVITLLDYGEFVI